MADVPETMRAVAVDHFGGIDELEIKELPVPEVGPDEVLIHVESIGVGIWDPFEIGGGFHAEGMAEKPRFPYVPGSDCAGKVVAVGERVSRCAPGDRVYAFTLVNPKGGSYAEYVVVGEGRVSRIPQGIDIRQAGVMPVDAITALRGLDDTLGVQSGESVLIFGASGGVGHLAVELAKRMGAKVLAAASGDDGVKVCQRLGADVVVNGREQDVAEAARAFAPAGIDAALVTASGEAANRALEAMRDGGRVAFPNGVMPEPRARPGVTVTSYDGVPDVAVIEKLNRLIEAGPFEVAIGRTFKLEDAPHALRALEGHHVGKFALTPSAP